ncbi:uncharacterized protein LOC130994041 [Salvia miltiorrhiza]|uniref:uncharacterized protein LOC130994041 n=1 Tax=Salvia miltiorrhiza TaxID=226208 RepID=UPI0025AD1F40|nr:uncharacterized protein LOC130994041 [Salvia miltiorrhiza]
MSVPRPSFWRVLSDTWRILSSNPLHFAALSLLFIFPISLFNVIHTLILPPSPSPLSHYRRLLSTEIPSLDKSQILYLVALLIFNLCSVASVTHSIFHGFNGKPIKLAASLKSILSSFLPLLATKIVYLIIFAAITFGYGICIGFVFLGLFFLGFDVEPSSKSSMAVVIVTMIPFLALFFYLGIKWYLAWSIVVVESKYGFAPFKRSSNLVKGAKLVALLMILVLAILQMILSGWFSALGGGRGCSGGVVVQLVAYAVLSSVVALFGLAADTVLLVHCKEFNNENGELEFVSDEKKLGQVYVPLPVDEVV